jgi:hypothetical protein
MKEVESKSPWVGKILTCKTCNRSYAVEAGDKIVMSRYGTFFSLLCGCTKTVDIDKPSDVY